MKITKNPQKNIFNFGAKENLLPIEFKHRRELIRICDNFNFYNLQDEEVTRCVSGSSLSISKAGLCRALKVLSRASTAPSPKRGLVAVAQLHATTATGLALSWHAPERQ